MSAPGVPEPVPVAPWRIDDALTSSERERGLERLADLGAADPMVRAMAERTAAIAASGPGGEARNVRLAALALAVVQRAGHVPDPVGEEWWQSARYTATHGGDCEDLAVLFVALVRVAGLAARVRWLDQPGQPLNHVSAQVRLGGAWRWAEASVAGAVLGESPYAAAERLGAFGAIGLGG